jgi:predicted nuclease of restriction endonuclease-like (RecB) superfamily
MKKLESSNNLIYSQIKEILSDARRKAYSAVNFAMVEAYWHIGKQIVETQDNNERAEYGTSLLKYLSERLTVDFGKGFDERSLRNMRQFYLMFPIRDAVRPELSWTHYRHILKVENENARNFYIDECIKSQWSTRQLENFKIQ